MSWLKWYRSSACGQKQQEKWGDLTWTWNFLRPHKTESWIVSDAACVPHQLYLPQPTHTWLITPLFQWPWQPHDAVALEKMDCSWMASQNILVTNMLSFNNKRPCLPISCSQNKHRACTMPGNKIKVPMYTQFAITYVLHSRAVMKSRILLQLHVWFFKCLFFNTAFYTKALRVYNIYLYT